MKIELSNGVVVIPTPEIAVRVKQIIFEEIDNCPAWPETGSSGVTEPTKLSQKFRKKFQAKTEEAKPRKGGYTPEEEANIIKMYNLGHGAKEIGKMVGHRSAATMNAKINFMIKKGQITKRDKIVLPSYEDDEDGDDDFKAL